MLAEKTAENTGVMRLTVLGKLAPKWLHWMSNVSVF